jgi:hypothetical protein
VRNVAAAERALPVGRLAVGGYVALTIALTASTGTPGCDLALIRNVPEFALPAATLMTTLRVACAPGARLPVD